MPDQTQVNNNSNEIIENLTFIAGDVYTERITFDEPCKSLKTIDLSTITRVILQL